MASAAHLVGKLTLARDIHHDNHRDKVKTPTAAHNLPQHKKAAEN